MRANPLFDLLWHHHSGSPGLADRLLAHAGSGGPGGPSGHPFQLPSWNSLVLDSAVTVQSVDQSAVFFRFFPA